MSRPVSWFRWYRGKVWHVGFADDALAACGSERPADAEAVGERAPVNARVCGDCVSMTLHLYALAQAGQMGDPRTPERGLIGVPGAPLPEAEVDQCICGHPGVDHDGGCEWPGCACSSPPRAPLPDVGDDEWPCGGCGHPNLDHDVDDMQWCRATGECLCPGLTRAG